MSEQTIGFIGLGLIGGSIARGIKRAHPDTVIMAYMRSRARLEQAKQEGIVDIILNGADEQLRQCDMIFLCTPVEYNASYLKAIRPYLKSGAIVTDVGSTKTNIHEEVIRLQMEDCFVGGHPMAGSEKTGYQAATAYLLENAYYILTPTAKTDTTVLHAFRDYIASLGSVPMIMDAKTHDHATASISHLPHIIAASLVNLIRETDDENETMKTIAAGGFKDITRIASSSPVMWQHICASNREQILTLIDRYTEELNTMRSLIAERKEKEIYDFFSHAKDYRDSITITSSGPLRKVFECYCDLIDEAGGIATIATILASNNISIKNIGIIHNREFEEGVLRIEFYDEDSAANASKLLQKYRYVIYEV